MNLPGALWRWISWVWPVHLAGTNGRHGPLEVRWEQGRKVLNSTNGNQSFGSLHRVWQRVFAHLELSQHPPKRVLLLGLGAGSVVHILRAELGIPAHITAVEIDPIMTSLAREHFGLDRHVDIEVLVGDAVIQVQMHQQRYDLIVVDLFDDLDLARGVDTRGFAHGLRERCADDGSVCFNTVSYDPGSELRCTRVHDNLLSVFNGVEEFRTEDLNRVFIAR
jgi:spermidine synthase